MKKLLIIALMLFAGVAAALSAEKYSSFNIRVNEGETAVDLDFHAREVTLNADNVDHLIWILSGVRMGLKPPIEETPSLLRRTFSAADISAWYPQPGLEATVEYPGKVVLLLRHPGYGWLRLSFPKEEAREIGEYLVEQSTKN